MPSGFDRVFVGGSPRRQTNIARPGTEPLDVMLADLGEQ